MTVAVIRRPRRRKILSVRGASLGEEQDRANTRVREGNRPPKGVWGYRRGGRLLVVQLTVTHRGKRRVKKAVSKPSPLTSTQAKERRRSEAGERTPLRRQKKERRLLAGQEKARKPGGIGFLSETREPSRELERSKNSLISSRLSSSDKTRRERGCRQRRVTKSTHQNMEKSLGKRRSCSFSKGRKQKEDSRKPKGCEKTARRKVQENFKKDPRRGTKKSPGQSSIDKESTRTRPHEPQKEQSPPVKGKEKASSLG